MSAWSSEFDAITTRSERSVGNAIKAWSIKTQKRINLGSPAAFSKQMSNAAQIAFAFLADCSHKQQRTFDRNLLVLNCLGVGDERCKSTTIVGDSGRKQLVIAFDDCEISVLWKHCIEMCADNDERF